MIVYGLIFLLFYIVPLVVAGLLIIRTVTVQAPGARAGLTTWLLVGFCLWLWFEFKPSLPDWLHWLHYWSNPVFAAAILAAPAALVAALLNWFRYYYPE